MNLQARTDADPIPLDNPVAAVEAGLDMYFTVWSTLMKSRLGVGTVSVEDYKAIMSIARERFSELKAKLKK
jgi:hypothetical protein